MDRAAFNNRGVSYYGSLERLPTMWNCVIEKEKLGFERVGACQIEKAGQVF
jgi:hypothetical protein